MPRKLTPKQCACGCGGTTKGGTWLTGHDRKLEAAIAEKAGGILELKALVEQTLNCQIEVKV